SVNRARVDRNKHKRCRFYYIEMISPWYRFFLLTVHFKYSSSTAVGDFAFDSYSNMPNAHPPLVLVHCTIICDVISWCKLQDLAANADHRRSGRRGRRRRRRTIFGLR
ncbi:unnamed protein product, partial [Ascophyllum nodosum]